MAPCRIVAAVSGGVDSTALLLGLAELREDGFDVECAHVNHRLRGADSEQDEAFVRDLAGRLGVTLHVEEGAFDERLVRARGIEAAARDVRYARLSELRERRGARFVATAHQQNDQAETVLMRLLTGSGLAGLRGIHPVREDGFIRPLLDVTRAELDAYLRKRNVTPRFDRSNDDPRFLRNRVRAMLRELGGVGQLANVAEQARALWPLVERAIDEAEEALATVRETRFITMPEDVWLRGALLQRHIRRLDPEARDYDAQRIARELGGSPRVSVTKTLELIREDVWVLRAAAAEMPRESWTVRSSRVPEGGAPSAPHQLIQLPRGAAAEFTVRTRQAGDRFQPLGMGQAKKLKDFLIDRKIAAGVRDRLPLLLWNGEIVWIAGVEVSEAFKVTEPGAGDLYEVWMEKTELAPVFSAEAIAARIRELGAEIRGDAGTAEVFLLGILKGTSVFLADLLRATPGDVSYGYIDVVRDSADSHGTDALEIDFLSFTDIRDRHVYLLKDVVNTGVIENYLLTQLRVHAPANIRLVALLDRTDARTVDIQADFRAFTVTDGTFAGYGLEHERRFGNLPFIGRVD
ncbi:MAG TPA: tRNA lysidine(34) synthetase TilS [Thermoanaerobaculia bacterium]|nr:tRNA lysidine(34) synthetase TilS [Thermoanaerobaculia bacterium]